MPSNLNLFVYFVSLVLDELASLVGFNMMADLANELRLVRLELMDLSLT